ncbi:uncharacterized protein MYCFIDRAFT_210966 [Pseudocercospora fijiensis CIRAD86]|uniref:Uncharacterized protein n=1 Tax=Pseudocercospora fijiensis (strain CIRAD86) TaxID=383855 RepID=M3B5W1_PSEFD|nr:uncharacterized protein MYCFIDRAFT_210966 [Pseudocercospora fijiensis CIRAD86]EME84742.1 hypothetical protein MYCFIDRAFT_210966 [Pseudocercospora fijiensis CIRAD86]
MREQMMTQEAGKRTQGGSDGSRRGDNWKRVTKACGTTDLHLANLGRKNTSNQVRLKGFTTVAKHSVSFSAWPKEQQLLMIDSVP